MEITLLEKATGISSTKPIEMSSVLVNKEGWKEIEAGKKEFVATLQCFEVMRLKLKIER